MLPRCGGLFWSANIYSWYLEEHAASGEKNPLGGGKWEAKGELPCSAEVPLDFDSVTSTAAEMRKSFTSSRELWYTTDVVHHLPFNKVVWW